MPNHDRPIPLTQGLPAEKMFPKLAPAQIARVAVHGRLRTIERGFVKTGPDLLPEDLAAAHWPLGRLPHLLETSRPGVFAVGDVRAGSIKRVASAVGEGSIAIGFVHQVLNE
ncbi:MAG: hypothetical protein EHM61_07695 [Acidobacteria bacterium]|nr:MAG: hypothetical protein EHM61_07695 [Acidobacteriota bacterium]